MITLSKSGNAVKFTFDENDHYLQNGTIEVPVNSLALIIDDSDMATFRKSASNDIFVSANYSEFGMSKAELEAWYKTYMVGSSGGGGGTGGTTPEEVQEMIDASLIPYSTTSEVDSKIDESVSGKADTSSVDTLNNTVTAHTADTTIHVTANEKAAWDNKSDFSGDYNDLVNKPTIPTVPTSNTAFTNDAGYITIDAISGKADTTAVTQINDALTTHTSNTDIHVTSADKSNWNAKADIEDIPSVTGYADSVAYNSTSKYVEFYHGGTGGTKVFEYDASPFLIDGMVQNVEIKNVSGTQTFQTGYNSQTYSQNPYFIASNYDTSATNAEGDISSFTMTSSSGARVLLKVFSTGGTETTVYNNAFTYNGTLPSSEYVTATFSNDTFTFVPAEGYRISTLNIVNVKDNDHMGMPEFHLCDLTVTAATTCLVISFNIDAGKQDINIPISQIFNASNYYTKSEVNQYVSSQVSTRVDRTTYTAYTANTQTVLSGKADTTAMTQAISEAVSGKADTSAVTEVNDVVTAHTANTTVHVTAQDKTTWNAKSDFSGSYNDLTDKPTIPTVPTSNTAFTNDAGYITSDALSGYAESSAVTEEITAAVSGKADSSDVYTKSEVDNAISAATDDMATETWVGQQGYITGVDLSNYATTAYVDGAVSGKVETSAITSAVTSASTDSEIPTAKAVWDIASQGGGGGGGGKAIEAGRGIAITTGETADTVSFNLPISAGTGTGTNSIITGVFRNEATASASFVGGNGGSNNQHSVASGEGSFAFGATCSATSINSTAFGGGCLSSGYGSFANGGYATYGRGHVEAIGVSSHAEGNQTSATSYCSHSEGYEVLASNSYEHSQGYYNVSNKANTTFGDSGNTLFSVGNGTSNNARHNAFEIRQNGDIYITLNGQDVKLQDILLQLSGTTS